MNVSVLGYLDFTEAFDLENDGSLQGLSQKDENGKIIAIAYASRSLQSDEWLMCNYSSAKLEFLVLMYVVTEKLRDYLWGSWFTIYADNNPLAYVKETC